MPNINNNNSFSDGNLDLARVYGLDDINDRTGQHLNDLAGYNLNNSQNQSQNQTHTQTHTQTQTQTQTQTSTNTNNNMPQQQSNSSMRNNMMQQPTNSIMENNTMQQPISSRMETNMIQRPSTNNEHNIQQGMSNVEHSISRQDGQRINELMPQRQEQTLPSTRESQRNNMMQYDNSNENNQLTVSSGENMNSFLSTQIGKNVSVQFLIGTNTLIEKSGELLSIGSNYIVLRENESNDMLVCDFDNIKFVKFEEISD